MAHRLLDKITSISERYLAAQIEAGAQAIQLFDSWAGILGREDYREFALPYARRIIDTLRPRGVPLIYFALNAAHLLPEIRDCGSDVVGLDWRTDLDEASKRLDRRFVLQGNLDPASLLAPRGVIEAQTRRILDLARDLPGHVFNLGHGILPDTPVENAQALIEIIRG